MYLVIYICLDGECEFHLYAPNNKIPMSDVKHAYYEISEFYEHNNSYKEYNYMKILLRKHQGIIIPRFWSYTYSTSSSSIIYNTKSKDIIGYLHAYLN